MIKNSRLFFYLLIVFGFLALSIFLYTQPIAQKNETFNLLANKGKINWQENNCSACHQIYGLGGYLGPDLTNYTAKKEHTLSAFAGVVKGGNKQMPPYNLTQQEITEIFAFLTSINKSGNGNPNKVRKNKWGMISNE